MTCGATSWVRGWRVRQTSFSFDHDQTLGLGPILVQIPVVEEFRGCSGPAATEFNATVVLRDDLMVVVGKMHEFAFRFTAEHLLEIIMQEGLVPLQRQYIVSAST